LNSASDCLSNFIAEITVMTTSLIATATIFLSSLKTDVPPALNETGAQAEASSVRYYKQSLRVDPAKLLKGIGLETNAFTHIRLGNRFDDPEIVGVGVLAPDVAEQVLPFSPVARLNQAVRRFLKAKGVDFASNSVLVLPETGVVYLQGSLDHVLFVGSIMRQFAPADPEAVRKPSPETP
jgi:hypothetical protein